MIDLIETPDEKIVFLLDGWVYDFGYDWFRVMTDTNLDYTIRKEYITRWIENKLFFVWRLSNGQVVALPAKGEAFDVLE